ncbi:LOW QUALITY PROTEIN: leucine-rich repeat- and IQ domain-containing protein 1 [Gastrophryne carolinensis]
MIVLDELPDSIISSLQILKQRTENAERLILQDLEANDSWKADPFSVPSEGIDAYVLAQLASECNEDPEAFMKRVLADIDEDNKKTIFNCDVTENVYGPIGDGSHEVIRLCYMEVEESCRQKLQQWEKEQEKLNELERAALIAQKAVIEKEIQEQDEKRENWKKEFEKELLRLNTLQKEQQERLDADLKKQNDSMAEDQREHQSLITKLEKELINERNVFEEQKAKARKHLEDLQNKSAVKIQAAFKAYQIYKKYSPILRQKKEELKRQNEMKEKMDREKKQLEDRVKLKLEEQKRREEEKKLHEETMKKKMEEAKHLEVQEQERRQREYEDKKKQEKQRLEREKILKQELNRKSEAKINTLNSAIQSDIVIEKHKNNHPCLEVTKTTLEDFIHDEQKHAKQYCETQAKISKEQQVQVKHDTQVNDSRCTHLPEKSPESISKEEQKQVKHDTQVNVGRCTRLPEGTLEKTSKEKQVPEKYDRQVNVDRLTDNKLMQTPIENASEKELGSPTNNCLLGHDKEINDKLEVVASSMTKMQTPYLKTEGKSASLTYAHSTGNILQHQDIQSMSGNRSNTFQISGQVTKETTGGKNESQDLPMTPRPFVLPDDVEDKRLAWMKSCIPWAKTLSDNRKNGVVRRTRKRKSSSTKRFPPINEALILRHGPWNSLQQVTTVTLLDLPGCCLSTLSKCEKLKYLSLRRCGLTILDGITNCKQLQYIDVQENCIKSVNCEDLENLSVLLLNRNQITSIHGLENCTNLMSLELSFNLITRISGLDSLRSLQRLLLDHNQLISTSGLEATPMLIYLDCSYNYLTELEGIENCGLLQILKLQGNNLSEIPKLNNHVLLREIFLDDNNLTTIEDMSSYWLPLMQFFSVSKNSLTHLASMYPFIYLKDLDLSSNCLSELQVVIQRLDGCIGLSRLSVSKNPFLQEVNWRSALLEKLPILQFLNDEEMRPEDYSDHMPASGSFLAFCQHQIYEMSRLWQILKRQEVKCSSLDSLDLYCKTLKELLKLSCEHRYAHEYGDTDVSEGNDPEILKEHAYQPVFGKSLHNGRNIHGEDTEMHIDKQKILLNQVQPPPTDSLANVKKDSVVKKRRTTAIQSQLLENSNTILQDAAYSDDSQQILKSSQPRQTDAAIRIQALWRGYVVRRDICYYEKLHEAASIIQSAWRHYYRRTTFFKKKHWAEPDVSSTKKQAATVIQAAWKGFFLRKKLAAAFAAFEREEIGDDYEEVNLDHLTYDENALEKEWPLDSTASHYEAIHLASKAEQVKRNKGRTWIPSEAWSGSEAASLHIGEEHETEKPKSRLEKPNLSHESSMKSNTDISFRSEKEEQISQEWGLKNAATVKLMLKRAHKMMSKQAKHKKMLDPAVRLALFKKNENKHTPVKPPKKTQPTKINYFQGKEESYSFSELPTETLSRSRELTYQWLHTQCGEGNSATLKSKHFLPELNHEVLNGGRVQLVANTLSREADDLDLVSVKSGSTLSQYRGKNLEIQRTTSTPPSLSNASVSTPVKINSGPQKKQRISFRDNPVQLSGGWGGGKKKGKALR